MADTIVVHLVRKLNGVEPLRAFVESYRRYAAGSPHELALIFKGFDNPAQLEPYRQVLAGIEYHSVSADDRQYVLSAYLAAAQALDAEFLMFMHSFSRLLGDNWLLHMRRCAGQPGVGIVGATGSYESLADCIAPARRRPLMMRWLKRQWRREHRAWLSLQRFDRFPNPCIRTNAFMLRKSLLLDIDARGLKTRVGNLQFESGKNSLTRQIQRRGLTPLVVGRDGVGYELADWHASRTFRSGNQVNLLVADNRTEEYRLAPPAEQLRLARRAWGERADSERSEEASDRAIAGRADIANRSGKEAA